VSEEKEALPDDGSPKGKTMAESRTNKSYLEYWAKEAARINRESAHDYIALICFDRHEPHFKRLFTYILRFQAELRSAEKSNIKSELSNTNLQYVGRHLAGCMNRLLNYRVSARESVELTDAMMGVMKGSSKTLDFRVVAEHALQKLRSNESQHCLDALDAALNGYFAADGYFDRAFAIAARGYIRHRVGQHRDAATDYKRAIELYKMVLEQPPVAKDVNVELKEVEILAKMLQDGTVSDPGIGVSRIKDRKIAELYTVKTAAPKDKGCLIA
jgi:tetratricopeptide (TPR) repeat protein